MPDKKPSITVHFEGDKSTKNKERFSEVIDIGLDGAPGVPVGKDDAVVEKLYVSKKHLKELGDPKAVTIIITAA